MVSDDNGEDGGDSRTLPQPTFLAAVRGLPLRMWRVPEEVGKYTLKVRATDVSPKSKNELPVAHKDSNYPQKYR